MRKTKILQNLDTCIVHCYEICFDLMLPITKTSELYLNSIKS